MAFVTAHILAGGVIAVPKDGLEIVLRLQRPAVRGESMTNGARADLAFGRVTGVASGVCVDSRLYRLPIA